MTWEAISNIADIVGAVAVVVSLVYVARQINQNTQASRSSTRQAIADSALVAVSDLIADSGMAQLMTRDMAGEEFTPAESLRLAGRGYMVMRHWENIYYQYRTGMLLEDEWRGFRRNLTALLQLRHMQQYWARESEIYSDAFKEEVARIQAEIESDPEASRSVILGVYEGGDQSHGVGKDHQ